MSKSFCSIKGHSENPLNIYCFNEDNRGLICAFCLLNSHKEYI